MELYQGLVSRRSIRKYTGEDKEEWVEGKKEGEKRRGGDEEMGIASSSRGHGTPRNDITFKSDAQ
jgi:hypothetical protein